jgi:16S rRNA (guanine966-N2)-methyltransferase
MRVIGGSARSVPLKTLPDMETRPILDRLKKSLFSILDSAGLLAGRRVLDLYAGAGTLGIEALSRGAAYCLFVERRPEAVGLLKENLAKTRLGECAEVRCGDVGRNVQALLAARFGVAPAGEPFELILYDPPFAFSREESSRVALEAEMSAALRLLSPEGRLVLRCEKAATPPAPAGGALARHWTDGPHALCFYEAHQSAGQ